MLYVFVKRYVEMWILICLVLSVSNVVVLGYVIVIVDLLFDWREKVKFIKLGFMYFVKDYCRYVFWLFWYDFIVWRNLFYGVW